MVDEETLQHAAEKSYNLPENVTLRLLSVTGQEIALPKPFDRVSTYVIDLTSEISGVYFLEITNDTQKEVARLIKK